MCRTWEAEPAHVLIERQLIDKFTKQLGFTLVKSVGLQNALPTAGDIHKALEELKAMDFSEYHGIFVVVAAHGQEGGVMAGPCASNRNIASGPVPIRAFSSAFQLAPQGEISSLAARTLVGKPKVFIFECCRVASQSDGPVPVQHPQRAPSGSFEGTGATVQPVFDHLRPPRRIDDPFEVPAAAAPGETVLLKTASGSYFRHVVQPGQPGTWVSPQRLYWTWDTYEEVRSADSSEVTTRNADLCFMYATMPFNMAGVNANSSNFLSEFMQTVERPLSLADVFAVANNRMQAKNAKGGRVMLDEGTYPQCAEVIGSLRRPLFVGGTGDVALAQMRTILSTIPEAEKQALLTQLLSEATPSPATRRADSNGRMRSLSGLSSHKRPQDCVTASPLVPPALRSGSLASDSSLSTATTVGAPLGELDEGPVCDGSPQRASMSVLDDGPQYTSMSTGNTFRSLSTTPPKPTVQQQLASLFQKLRDPNELRDLHAAGVL